MLRIWAILFGIVFIFAGVAAFLPDFTPNDFLFSYFTADTLNNIIYILTGVIAIMAATSYRTTRWYFKIIGVIYLAGAIAAYWLDGDLYLIDVNTADTILYAVIAIIALYLGFLTKRRNQ